MALNPSMLVQNPAPNKSNNIKLSTLISYSLDSSYQFQPQAIEILNGLRQKGVISDNEIERVKKTKTEDESDKINAETGAPKQDDTIITLSDGTALTKEMLNTPEKLEIVKANKNNINFAFLIQYIDDKELDTFIDSESPQIRKIVAEKINVNKLNEFKNEIDKDVLDTVIERITAFDGSELLRLNPNLDAEQTQKLTNKIENFEMFRDDLENVDIKKEGADEENIIKKLFPTYISPEEEKSLLNKVFGNKADNILKLMKRADNGNSKAIEELDALAPNPGSKEFNAIFGHASEKDIQDFINFKETILNGTKEEAYDEVYSEINSLLRQVESDNEVALEKIKIANDRFTKEGISFNELIAKNLKKQGVSDSQVVERMKQISDNLASVSKKEQDNEKFKLSNLKEEFDYINTLEGQDFYDVMNIIKEKNPEDKLTLIDYLEPEKLKDYFLHEFENDPAYHVKQSEIDKELKTNKIVVYRGGEFKDNRGYVSTNEEYAKEFGKTGKFEIDKNDILDLTNSEHREMISDKFGGDMLHILSPNPDSLPNVGDRLTLEKLEDIAQKLGFKATAQLDGSEISFDIYDGNILNKYKDEKVEDSYFSNVDSKDNIYRGSKYTEEDSKENYTPSGYYTGAYYFTGKDAETKAKEFGDNISSLNIKNSKLYKIENDKDAQKLKKEAPQHGFDTNEGSGHNESKYLESIGYDGIERGNETIIFNPDKFKNSKDFSNSFSKMAKDNYEGLLDIAQEFTKNDSNKVLPVKKELLNNLEPTDLMLFAEDKNEDIRQIVSYKAPAKEVSALLEKYTTDDKLKDTKSILNLIDRDNKEEDFSKLIYYDNANVRKAISSKIKSPQIIEKFLSSEFNKDRKSKSTISNLLANISDNQIKNIEKHDSKLWNNIKDFVKDKYNIELEDSSEFQSALSEIEANRKEALKQQELNKQEEKETNQKKIETKENIEKKLKGFDVALEENDNINGYNGIDGKDAIVIDLKDNDITDKKLIDKINDIAIDNNQKKVYISKKVNLDSNEVYGKPQKDGSVYQPEITFNFTSGLNKGELNELTKYLHEIGLPGFVLNKDNLTFYNVGDNNEQYEEQCQKIAEWADSRGITTKSEQNTEQLWDTGSKTGEEESQSESNNNSNDTEAERISGQEGRSREEASRTKTKNIEPISKEGLFRRGLEGDRGGTRLLHIGDKDVKPVNVYESNPLITNKLKDVGTSNPDEPLYEIDDAETFYNQLIDSKKNNIHGASVHAYDKEDYKNMKLFVSGDGMSGLAVKKDGDIVSVFRNPKTDKKVFANLFSLAIANGGKKLDCFDTVLPRLYSAYGFKVASRLKWDDEYAPEGWDKDIYKKYNNGEPDVVFMYYDEDNPMAFAEKTYEDYNINNNPEYSKDYDDAVAKQLEDLGKIEKSSTDNENEENITIDNDGNIFENGKTIFSGDNYNDGIKYLKSHYPDKLKEIVNFNKNNWQSELSDNVASKHIDISLLPKLSSGGSGRDVYDLGDDKVLKLAKTAKGLLQNGAEQPDYMIEDWRPKIYGSGKDYVVVEKVDRNDNKMRKFLKPLQKFTAKDFEDHTVELQQEMEKLGLEDFNNYDLLWNDFIAPRNWGINKEGHPILIDGGALLKNVHFQSKIDAYTQKEWKGVLQERNRAKKESRIEAPHTFSPNEENYVSDDTRYYSEYTDVYKELEPFIDGLGVSGEESKKQLVNQVIGGNPIVRQMLFNEMNDPDKYFDTLTKLDEKNNIINKKRIEEYTSEKNKFIEETKDIISKEALEEAIDDDVLYEINNAIHVYFEKNEDKFKPSPEEEDKLLDKISEIEEKINELQGKWMENRTRNMPSDEHAKMQKEINDKIEYLVSQEKPYKDKLYVANNMKNKLIEKAIRIMKEKEQIDDLSNVPVIENKYKTKDIFNEKYKEGYSSLKTIADSLSKNIKKLSDLDFDKLLPDTVKTGLGIENENLTFIETRNKILSKIKEETFVKNPSELKHTLVDISSYKDTSKVENTINKAIPIFNKMISKELTDDISIANEPTFVLSSDVGRAYFTSQRNSININEDAPVSTLIHELGHYLEHNNPKVHKLCVDFLKKRTAGETKKPLNDLLNTKGYGHEEVAKKDKFFNAYCGKIYENNNYPSIIDATEILSMGLETMADDPVSFAISDPEYFEFVYNIMHNGNLTK